MGMFTKTNTTPAEPGSTPTRRIDDTSLDSQSGRSLPILHRAFIRVLVSEIRAMLDERDVEREKRDHQAREQAIERMIGGADAEYRGRTQQDG